MADPGARRLRGFLLEGRPLRRKPPGEVPRWAPDMEEVAAFGRRFWKRRTTVRQPDVKPDGTSTGAGGLEAELLRLTESDKSILTELNGCYRVPRKSFTSLCHSLGKLVECWSQNLNRFLKEVEPDARAPAFVCVRQIPAPCFSMTQQSLKMTANPDLLISSVKSIFCPFR